jgi:hypothetical protein
MKRAMTTARMSNWLLGLTSVAILCTLFYFVSTHEPEHVIYRMKSDDSFSITPALKELSKLMKQHRHAKFLSVKQENVELLFSVDYNRQTTELTWHMIEKPRYIWVFRKELPFVKRLNARSCTPDTIMTDSLTESAVHQWASRPR